MTPEAYMRRYHRGCRCDEAETTAIPPEGLYPSSCPLAAENVLPCGCNQTETPDPEPDDCCCKQSMVEALRLLCGEPLSSLVNFDAFFFLTDDLAIGSPLSVPGENTDNISYPTGSLHRFSPCNCDLLEIGGTAYFAIPDTDITALEDVDRLSLCAIKAAAFQVKPSECDDCEENNYDRAIRAIRRAIRAEGENSSVCATCGGSGVTTNDGGSDCDTCCCDEGILTELSTRNLSRLATFTAGPLVLQNVTVLGSLGSVLILTDEDLSRVYLVCANAIETLG